MEGETFWAEEDRRVQAQNRRPPTSTVRLEVGDMVRVAERAAGV